MTPPKPTIAPTAPITPGASGASGLRTVAARPDPGGCIVYDPLTGLTHRAGLALARGRIRLNQELVASWPVVHPADTQDRMPVSVCWSPLVRCNLACPHCLDDKQLPELAGGDRRRIAEVLAASPVAGVDISGGEPLLLRELPELVAILTAGGCTVSITTNGTHLARRAEALAAHVDAVRVSVDGPNAAGHDRWRGTGSFDRAVAGIRAAIAHGIPTQIQTVLMRSTAPTLDRVIELAARLGARGVTLLQMLPIGEGAALTDEPLSDGHAEDLLARLAITSAVPVRLRTRRAAEGFTVIRADGRVWRNQPGARHISVLHELRAVEDLTLTGQDGSA